MITDNKIKYNYFVNTEGLKYVSTRSGKPYENFYINGVCLIKEYPEIEILYLCYINKNENTNT